MPIFDPAQAFQAGQAMGSGASSLPSFLSAITDRLKSHLEQRDKTRSAIEAQVGSETALAPWKLQQKQAELGLEAQKEKDVYAYRSDLEAKSPQGLLANARAQRQQQLMGQDGQAKQPLPPGFVEINGRVFRDPSYVNPEKGGGEASGKLALARESVNNIAKVKTILFPTGKPESFRRWVAAGSKIPFTGGAVPFAYEPQTIDRLLRTALAARQLIQTGVAAREDEKDELLRQFKAGALSNPRAALESLDQLDVFYKDYSKIAGPGGTGYLSSGEDQPLDPGTPIDDEESDYQDQV